MLSASSASQSDLPAIPNCLAKYRQIAVDWVTFFPSTSKMGSWPYGVAKKMKNYLILSEKP